MGHGAGIIVLPWLAVGPGFHVDVMGIGNLILGDDPRAAAAMGTLAFTDELGPPHHATGRDIEHRHIAENIVEGLFFGNVLGGLADDEGELGFGLIDDASGNIAQFDLTVGADEVVTRSPPLPRMVQRLSSQVTDSTPGIA